MSLHLTPAMLEAAYELLKTTPPFKAWKLPDADEVEFHVVQMRAQDQADHHWNGTRHVIRIAANKHKTLPRMIETMAHEMVHMREIQLALRLDVAHGKHFQRMADQVCRHHCFDRGQF